MSNVTQFENMKDAIGRDEIEQLGPEIDESHEALSDHRRRLSSTFRPRIVCCVLLVAALSCFAFVPLGFAVAYANRLACVFAWSSIPQ